MSPISGKGSEPEGRLSTSASARLSVPPADGDYDYLAASLVTDGFRPTHSGPTTPPQPPQDDGRRRPSTPSLTSASSTLLTDDTPASSVRKGRPPSMSKNHNPHYSLSLRHDLPPLARQPTDSTGSIASFPADGAYQGPSAPSHPYQLYPQNVRIARTLSVGTSSTLPVSESSYGGPRGPSHPYSLYPQTDGIESDAVQAAAIPLGFHGLPDQYRRRIGPDGDDVADIIGPDGHTEQLPPYTRYPEQAYVQKVAAVDGTPDVQGGATIITPVPAARLSTIPPISGAGGIGLATRNPEFESTDDLDSPRSRHSTHSFSSDDSRRRIQLDGEGMTEKDKPPKKWQLWMRRKMCGVIPFWAIVLTIIVLVAMGAIAGAVAGTLKDGRKNPRKEGAWEPFDALPIPTPPPDLQPLPIGTFAVPLTTSGASYSCFQKPALAQAWNCRLVVAGLYLTVTREDGDYRASLNCNHSYTLLNNVYSYGEQPPLIQKPVTLELVSDKFEVSRGPAWFKMLPYNKTVILPESSLSSLGASSGAQLRARHGASASTGIPNVKRKGVAQPGERPWVCTWPDTYLELFIYPQQNSSYSNWPKSFATSSPPPPAPSSSFSYSTASTELSTSTLASSPNPTPSAVEANYDSSSENDDVFLSLPGRGRDQQQPPGTIPSNPPSTRYRGYFPPPQNLEAAEPSPDSTSSSTSAPPPPPPPPPFSTPKHGSPPPPPPPTTTTTTPRTTIPRSTLTTELSATSTQPFGPIDTADPFRPLLPPYPRAIKLEERRVSTTGAPPARCTQVEIQGPDQEARVLRHEDGRPIVVVIDEIEGFGLPPGGVGAGELARAAGDDVAVGVFERGEGGGQGGGGPPDISRCACTWVLW
ncbi:hypothetical protein VTI74DRAFT_1682 [Chaetomium olivicolor]